LLREFGEVLPRVNLNGRRGSAGSISGFEEVDRSGRPNWGFGVLVGGFNEIVAVFAATRAARRKCRHKAWELGGMQCTVPRNECGERAGGSGFGAARVWPLGDAVDAV